MTKNFTLRELTASSTARARGIDNSPPPQVVERLKTLAWDVLQPLRDRWGKPITVTNGYRSPALNAAVGGSPTSQHLKGEAADITSHDNKALFELAKQMMREGSLKVGQLIDEKNYSWIHISLPYSRVNQILHWNGRTYTDEKL